MRLASPALAANLATNLRYYRRNRLLVAGAFTLLVLLGLFAIPTAIYSTAGQRFRMVGSLLQSFDLFTVLLIGVLGLVAVPAHLRSRSYELVVTRACPPETWLLSHYASAGLVAAGLCLTGFVLGGVMFLALDIPFQWGLAYLAVYTFCKAMILFSYLTFLAILLHPALAALVALLLQEGTFWTLLLWVGSGTSVTQSKAFLAFLSALEPVLRLAYAVVPTYAPYSSAAQRITATFRIEAGDLTHLGVAALYSAVLGLLLYLLTALALRRRPQKR